MPPSIEQILRRAIADRTPVTLRYDSGGDREVHPHALFRRPSGGLCLHGYQVAGVTSSPGSLPAWRPFSLDKIDDVVVGDGRFEIAAGFNPAGRIYEHGLVAYVRPG